MTNTGPGSGGGRTPTPDEWKRLEPLLDVLLDTPPDRRSALLAELSAGDSARRAELESLLAECERGYLPLEQPAADRFAAVFGDEPPVVPALLASRYEIVREVGRGGMAVVFLARDLKHGRDVAVKVVRPELAVALGRSRFLREIGIAARLRHPHIVPLYDSGEQASGPPAPDGSGSGPAVLYYVMPYEPGRSLRERLSHHGPLPVRDVLAILRDVCEALAHAHQQGIVHCDIKPENVLLSGTHALVADFGVARALREAREDATPVLSGMAPGTLAYMAPEQATSARGMDHRADIYSVGILAHELLTGRLPVAGDGLIEARPTSADAGPRMGQGLQEPGTLDDFVRRCLEPEPDDRFQNADEMLRHLGEITAAAHAAAPDGLPRRRSRAGMLVGFALGGLGLAAIAFGLSRDRDERPPLLLGRASQVTAEPGLEVQPSMSPDGRHVAYAFGHSLQMHIAVRPIAGGRSVRLTEGGSENEWLPRWSPDGTRVLFLSRGGVFSVLAGGGATREEVPGRPGAMVRSATWSPDGRQIAYVRGDSLLVRPIGSARDRLVTRAADLHSCAWSPDDARLACVSGNSFYMTVGSEFGAGPMFGNLAPSRIVLIPVKGGPPESVTDSTSLHQSPAWSRDGRTLYYVSNGQGPRDVYALDVEASRPDRRPVRVTTGMGAHSIDLSADGSHIVYAAYRASANIWAVPIPARSGGPLPDPVPLTSGNQTVEGVRVSPDGLWLIYDSDVSGNSDVYRMPAAGGEPERLTSEPWDEFRGVLSPDGRELVYHSYQTGARNLFLRPLDGNATQQLTRSASPRSMANWSPDGRALALFDIAAGKILVMRRDGRGRWSEPRFTGGHGWRPEWSPDGRSIAFVSPADGRIRVVPADSGIQRDLYVPHAGGPLAELAIFSPNGRELYFKSHDSAGRASFWTVPVTGGRPRLLLRFDDPERASNRFEFASDGKRFYFTMEDRQSDIWVAEVAVP